jgi:hypothetical protein
MFFNEFPQGRLARHHKRIEKGKKKRGIRISNIRLGRPPWENKEFRMMK